MAEFIAGLLSGIIVGLTVGFLLWGIVLLTHEKQAFDRGFMVQCVGKTGYYWECE